MFQAHKIKSIRALHDHIIVKDMEFNGRKLSSGIILPGDDGKTSGIRPRWAQVYVIGPEQKDVIPGQWVCVAHGRWTRGSKIEIDGKEITVRRIDPKDILMVSDEAPAGDDTISDSVQAEALTR